MTILINMTVLFSTMASAEDAYIIKGDHFGCVDKKYFEKLMDYSSQHNTEAFKRSLSEGFISGQCTTLKDGEKVFLMDSSLFPNLFKVWRQGNILEYWTNMDAVKKMDYINNQNYQ